MLQRLGHNGALCVSLRLFCLLPPSPIFDFCRNTRNYRWSSTYKVLTNDFACYSRESVNISTMETRGENFLKIALVITSHHNEILYHPCCDFELIFCPFKSRDKGEFCCFSFFGLPSPVLCIRLHAQVDKLSKRVDSGRYIFKQIHTTNLIRTLPTFLSSKRISNFWVISSTTRQRGKNFNCYF